MKKTAIAVAVVALAVLMVLPIMRSVNLSAGKPVTSDRTLIADGWPMPPAHAAVPTERVFDGRQYTRGRWLAHAAVPTGRVFDGRQYTRGRWLAHAAVPAERVFDGRQYTRGRWLAHAAVPTGRVFDGR